MSETSPVDGLRTRLARTSLKTRIAGVGVGLLAVLFLMGSGPEGESVVVEIPSGSSSPQVAEILEDNGVVRSARTFHVYARLRGADEGAIRSPVCQFPCPDRPGSDQEAAT